MRLLVFETPKCKYMLFVDHVYDWENLKRQYPVLHQSQWLADKLLENVDTAHLPMGQLIPLEKVYQAGNPDAVSLIKSLPSSIAEVVKGESPFQMDADVTTFTADEMAIAGKEIKTEWVNPPLPSNPPYETKEDVVVPPEMKTTKTKQHGKLKS